MALVNHYMQGSYATFSSRVVSPTNKVEFKYGTTLHRLLKAERFPVLRQNKSSLSVGDALVSAPNTKFLKIAAFKGSAKNDNSKGRASRSKSVELFENLSTESTEIQDFGLPYSSEVERISGSQAIKELFKNWLILLRSSLPSDEAADRTFEESDPRRISEVPNLTPRENQGNILSQIWGFFLGLDAAVKVPLLSFLPLYLAVNLAYGVQVSKELTPLWIIGPLILALYIKLFRGICALYAFTFKQTAKMVRNYPASYTYIVDGKLKEEIHFRLYQPMLDFKNKNYKDFPERKLKELKMWVGEKYLDCVESIWPTYCRTIRFLKRANLI